NVTSVTRRRRKPTPSSRTSTPCGTCGKPSPPSGAVLATPAPRRHPPQEHRAVALGVLAERHSVGHRHRATRSQGQRLHGLKCANPDPHGQTSRSDNYYTVIIADHGGRVVDTPWSPTCPPLYVRRSG